MQRDASALKGNDMKIMIFTLIGLLQLSCESTKQPQMDVWEEPIDSDEGKDSKSPVGQIEPEEKFEITVLEEKEPWEPEEISGYAEDESLLLTDKESIKKGPNARMQKLDKISGTNPGIGDEAKLSGRKNKFLTMKPKEKNTKVYDKPNGKAVARVRDNIKVKVYDIKQGWGKLAPNRYIKINDFDKLNQKSRLSH